MGARVLRSCGDLAGRFSTRLHGGNSRPGELQTRAEAADVMGFHAAERKFESTDCFTAHR